jgi:putative endonuclease
VRANGSTDQRKLLGDQGEELACRFLGKSGYRILERNFRTRWGELDAVAWEDGELVFVEVRTRSGSQMGSAAESVGPHKQRQLIKMAKLYLVNKRVSQEQTCRFDVVEMQPVDEDQWACNIIRDAFILE